MTTELTQPVLASWTVTVEAVSPLHIGAGGPPLVAEYDFVLHRGRLVVLDQEALLDRLSDEQLAHWRDQPVSSLFQREELAQLAAYTLPAPRTGAVRELRPFIKTAEGQPYLPGSSLKGALRSALARALADPARVRDALDRLVQRTRARERPPRREWAGQDVERAVLGPNPNQDLLRPLHVADLHAPGTVALDLATAQVHSLRGDTLYPKQERGTTLLEVVPAGATFAGTLVLEEYAFGPEARRRNVSAARRAELDELVRPLRADGHAQLEAEAGLHRRHGPRGTATWYSGLLQRAGRLGPQSFFLQLGWGTGWTSKTLADRVARHPRFPDLRRQYRLGREGQPFPKSRRLAVDGPAPLPLGWALVTLRPSG